MCNIFIHDKNIKIVSYSNISPHLREFVHISTKRYPSPKFYANVASQVLISSSSTAIRRMLKLENWLKHSFAPNLTIHMAQNKHHRHLC